MRAVLSVSIDGALKKRIEKAAKSAGVSKSEIVKKALERYLVRREFAELRARLVPYGEATGFLTDEDIFNSIS